MPTKNITSLKVLTSPVGFFPERGLYLSGPAGYRVKGVPIQKSKQSVSFGDNSRLRNLSEMRAKQM